MLATNRTVSHLFTLSRYSCSCSGILRSCSGAAAALERDQLDYDVCIVGAGPAGLSAAIRLKQLAKEAETNVDVCVLEKGGRVGVYRTGRS
jgi:ribulose 1,5-bisphosphate synthetase/thiazole synthase